ncbi:plasmid mobilization relaxosome protein MobC [uncultured Bradyrhizobium sp.]|uniref:plasmid mobilization protein n=1 Tax=uncultured Bradyrhizobium sp. TaxID=199684 RepID=UPI0035CA61AD
MDKQKTERGKPFSIRLTEDEKNTLRTKAAGVPLGMFIREIILDKKIKPQLTRRRYPIKDADAFARLLGLLGQSRIANNLNQLAKAANVGTLPVSDETEAELRAACADVTAMRLLLLTALGILVIESATTSSMSDEFSRSAGDPSQ